MGYDTWFEGELTITPPLSAEHANYLAAFAEKRHVRRDPSKAAAIPDPLRIAVGLPIGVEGCYFVAGSGGAYEEEYDDAVIDGNSPPVGQPGLWCGWMPSEDRQHLIADEDYNRDYVEWLEYLLITFLGEWKYTVNGKVQWFGDNPLDRGTLVVTGNRLEVIPVELIGGERIESIIQELDEFRELLAGNNSEEDLHQFLKYNESMLSMTSTVEPLSKFPLGSDFVTDFVIHEIPDGYVLVEIERPGMKLFNKPKKSEYPPERSRDFNHAIEQTENWRAWVGRNHGYISQKLPGISTSPLCWLIAGRSTQLSEGERQQLFRYNEQHRQSLRVWTYDDFLERIENVVNRLTGDYLKGGEKS